MITLTNDELAEIITEQLPQLLNAKPELKIPLYKIFLNSFASMREFEQLHKEVTDLRGEVRANHEETTHRFDQVDHRFDEVDRRFNQVDRRFEKVEGDVDDLRSEVQAFREETTHRFDQVDHRFDEVDRRFEKIEKEVDDLRREVRANHEETTHRFDQVDRRFEKIEADVDDLRREFQAFREETKHRFEKVEGAIETLRQEVTDGFKRMERLIDRLGGRWGIRNEKLFRATMVSLFEESFGVQVQRRLINGEEFDVVISNGDHILIEIAASANRHIVERLERKREFYIEETGIRPARFIFAIASIYSRRAEALRQAGFEVIEPDDDDDFED